MQINRLDTIVSNNVSYSVKLSTDDQKIHILQDISETLAMIYDSLNKKSDEETATIVPYEELGNYEGLHLETIDYKEGYPVRFVRYVSSNKSSYVSVIAFGEEMELKEKDYEKTWRCWNIEPTMEEKENAKWIKLKA